MSETSAISPVSPIQHRDIRSASQPFKRDKDHDSKWSMGVRPATDVNLGMFTIDGRPTDFSGIGSENPREKVRPEKKWSQISHTDYKSHANKTPKPTNHAGYYDAPRLIRKVDALVDAAEHTSSPLSKSLLELLPQHTNNTQTSVQTVLGSGDDGILYSFDNKGKSPGVKGREVDLGGLVELAEKKWAAEQTDKIVKGEYEVIDGKGETTVLGSGKKGKRSPKQRATKSEVVVEKGDVEEEDEFELI